MNAVMSTREFIAARKRQPISDGAPNAPIALRLKLAGGERTVVFSKHDNCCSVTCRESTFIKATGGVYYQNYK